MLFQIKGTRTLSQQKPQGLQQALRCPEAPVNLPLSHCQHFLQFLRHVLSILTATQSSR